MTSARAFNVGFISIIGKPGKIKQKYPDGQAYILHAGERNVEQAGKFRSGFPEAGNAMPEPDTTCPGTSQAQSLSMAQEHPASSVLLSVSRRQPVDYQDKGPAPVVLVSRDLIIDTDPHPLETDMKHIVRRPEVHGAVLASLI